MNLSIARSFLIFCALSLSGMAATRTARASSVDLNFKANVGGSIFAQVLQPDGKIVIAGQFNQVNGVTVSNLARVNADGSLDTSFSSTIDKLVYTIALQTDGKLVIGGTFTEVDGQLCNYITRLNADGTLDNSFQVTVNDWVYACALQPDGQVVIGGLFTSVNNETYERVARLNPDGRSDPTFYAGSIVDGFVRSLSLESDGTILVGGLLTTYYGQTDYLLRLNADSSIDVSFNASVTDEVLAISIQADQKILVAGQFRQVAGETRSNFARINADGSLDTAFNPSFDGLTSAIAQVAGGEVVVGGSFAHVDGVARSNIARLNADGSLDGFFNTKLDGAVGALTLQPDGKLIVGGFFTSVDGMSTGALVRLNNDLDPNDIPVITLTSATPSIISGSGEAGQVELALSTGIASDLTISYSVSGTADPGVDYLKLKGTAKVKAGHEGKTININPQGDLGGAEKKTVKITLMPGVGYVIGTPDSAKVKILAGGFQ